MAEPTEKTEKADGACAVCGRRLLLGERTSPYISREGSEVDVCELCKSRAESAGWMRPEDVSAPSPEPARRTRRKRGDLLGGLLTRPARERTREPRPARGRRSAAEAAIDAAVEASNAAEGAPRNPAKDPPSDPAPEQAPVRSSAGPDVNQAVSAFNASENRRTIAGLSRSLGQPQATVIAIRTAGGDTGARLTVAWDLAWYQWEIGPGKRHPEIRQSGKGETLDQLRAADRNWNLEMSEDGQLSRRKRGEA